MNRLLELANKQNLQYITPKTSVFEASQVMSQNHIGSILVRDQGEVVGIFSERDLMNRVVTHGLDYTSTTVSDVMTKEIQMVSTEENAESCYRLMKKLKCRHLPIQQQGKVIGMVSIRDILKWMIEDAQDENEQLKGYIQTQ
jgi:CBS domain-containing protein